MMSVSLSYKNQPLNIVYILSQRLYERSVGLLLRDDCQFLAQVVNALRHDFRIAANALHRILNILLATLPHRVDDLLLLLL